MWNGQDICLRGGKNQIFIYYFRELFPLKVPDLPVF